MIKLILLHLFFDGTLQGQGEYFNMLENRLPPELERKGVTFKELEQFFILLNNITDFAYVFR